LIKGSSYLVF